ncbi:MAG: serine/threonine protein kinase [Nannocystaceae bacterium]|nr:protein kinase [bacterium]
MTAPLTDRPASPLGTRIGGFLLQERLGAGGMAEVFLAARAGPERTELAALKRLLPHLTFDAEFVRMFLAEVKLTSELDHPGIAKVLEYGTGEGGHFLAMEYVHGHDVRAVLAKVSDRGAELGFALGVIADLADALHYAHEFRSSDGRVQGLVHRDVSPSNVRIATDGSVKLIDFGIAHVAGHTRMTKAGTVKGKVGYMSPEQCRAEAVDRRTDVFALGVMLYELTTGRRAFFGSTDLETLARIIQGQYASPQAVKPELPTEIAALIVRMLESRPSKRPSTTAAVSEALRGFAARAGLQIDAASRARDLQALFGDPSEPALPLSAPTLHNASAKTRIAPAPVRVEPEPERSSRWAPALLLGLLVAAVGAGGYVAGQQTSDVDAPPSQPRPTAATTPEPAASAQAAVPTRERLAAPPPERTEVEAPPAEDDPVEVIEVEDPEPSTPRRRPSKARRPVDAEKPPGPSIDPDSLLAPSLRQ